MNLQPNLFNAKGRIVTEILGRNKYSNYKQALNEAISNSLDAKATRIQIFLNKDSIEIMDNGIGMSEEDLVSRYFTLGEKNRVESARGLFGIGVCANAALGDQLTIQTRLLGENIGINAVIDFTKVEQMDAGSYKSETWEKIDLSNRDFSTYIRVEKLRWSTIEQKDIINFLTAKHWPLLLDKSIGLSIEVNGEQIIATEPTDVEKYEFNNQIEFRLGDKKVPAISLDCGRVEGVFYLKESGFEEPSIDVYVKNQRIDAYSGDQVDWLRIKDLTSTEGFRRRLKGIIKVDATDEISIQKRSTSDRNVLTLKSDRTGFFEESKAFKELCAYLNEKTKGKTLNLPNGGILRLIHSEWYKNRGTDIGKTQELINKLEPELKNDLTKIYEEEKMSTMSGGSLQKLKRKKIEENISKSENLLFKCPQCENILRIKIGIFKQWQHALDIEKNKLRKEYWTCNACGYILDPIVDKYKKGPIKGKEIFQVHLADGFLTHILAESLGRDGPRSIYIPEESVIKINAEHAMLIYSVKSSDEAFKCYLLDSIVFAISASRSAETGEKFEIVYNKESSKINKVINIDEYESTLSKLRIKMKDTERSDSILNSAVG